MKRLLVAFGVLVLSFNLFAETQWKMATSYSENSHHTRAIRHFVDQIRDKTAGSINIEVFPAQSLFSKKDILPATRGGEVQFGEIIMSLYGDEYPLWEIDSLPFLANTYEKSEKLWSLSRNQIAKDLEEMNLVLLYAVPWPGQNFYSKKMIDSNLFFDNKKVRSYSPTTAKIITLLGAQPKSVSVAEIEKAFTDGEIDAMITSSTTGISSEAWQFSNHYTKVNAFFPKNMVFMNKGTWDSLDSSTQAIIREAANDAEKFGWGLSKSEQEKNEGILMSQGMSVSEPNRQVLQLLFRVGQQMAFDWRERADRQSLKIMQEFRGY